MHFEANLPPSAGFRHLKRPLNQGESVPRFPSLFEQLTACSRGTLAVPTAESDIEAIDDGDDEV